MTLLIPMLVGSWLASFGGEPPTTNANPPTHQAEVRPECIHAKRDMVRLLSGDSEPRGAVAGGGVAGDCSPLGDSDVLHYDLDLSINPATKSLTGTNVITIQSLAESLSCIEIQLSDTFTITNLLVDGEQAPWDRLDSARVAVTLPGIVAGESFEIEVSYTGVPIGKGFGSIVFATDSGQPFVFTLSEPYYAHTWWPVKEDSNDKATADLRFTVPSALKVASNGVLQGTEEHRDGTKTFHWATSYPTAPYLFSFAAASYVEFSDTWTYGDISMPLQFFILHTSNSPQNQTAWKACKPMLTVFSDLFDVYPFADEKYGIYQFGFGGGMEHQTMTGQGGFGLSLTSHELAHQWWGDNVTCGAWNDIWLNEGFATYSEALWEEFDGSGVPANDLKGAMSARKPSNLNVTVYRTDISDVSSLFSTNAVYRKGAWVLHMLRHVLGDANFFDMLRAYRDAHQYSTAVTDDLQEVAESFYGGDLSWFFDPWVYQPGAPSYQWAWKNYTAAGTSWVDVYVKQTQTASYPIFTMPIDIVLNGSGFGQTSTVFNSSSIQHFLIEVPGAVTSASFDPQEWILRGTGQSVGFVDGPPRVVATLPVDGSEISVATEMPIAVTFHKPVVGVESGVELLDGDGRAIGGVIDYDAASQTATFTPDHPLEADTYTLVISDSVSDGLSHALDGETNSAGMLPSGDGLPGGEFVSTFSVVAPADLTGDGTVGGDDLGLLLAAWGTDDTSADLNGDGVVDGADLGILLSSWG